MEEIDHIPATLSDLELRYIRFFYVNLLKMKQEVENAPEILSLVSALSASMLASDDHEADAEVLVRLFHETLAKDGLKAALIDVADFVLEEPTSHDDKEVQQ